MYIAFKWLSGLVMVMWIGLCCIDYCLKRSKNNGTGVLYESAFKNVSTPMETNPQVRLEQFNHKNGSQQPGVTLLHCNIFLAGAFAVSVFNKKTEILLFTKTKIAKINFRLILRSSTHRIKQFLISHSIAAAFFLWKNVIISIMKIKNIFDILKRRNESKQQKINIILLKKLKEIGEERKNLGQLLIAAIHENKSIRMQYQLETMAKHRLLQHIDDTQNKIKESRSKFVSFQQLYLVIHQENLFLKARVQKLIKDKDEVERNLLGLITQVYRSKNSDLKLYCSRLIVQTKDNLLNSDVSAEIRNFLKKTQRCNASSSYQLSGDQDIDSTARSSSRYTYITEVLQGIKDSTIPSATDAPRLKGLPGEYVWTVKDKNGVIEKLYEYDYESSLNNGDTIRRIRQYSVYIDKDCLLDYSNSRTVIYETNSNTRVRGKFVTGSKAFQKFLRENKNILPSPTRGPALTCG